MAENHQIEKQIDKSFFFRSIIYFSSQVWVEMQNHDLIRQPTDIRLLENMNVAQFLVELPAHEQIIESKIQVQTTLVIYFCLFDWRFLSFHSRSKQYWI